MDSPIVHLPPELFDALQHIAGKGDVSIDSFVINAVKRDLSLRSPTTTARVKGSREISPLRAMFAKHLARVHDWNGLERRLRRDGYYLGMAKGVLCLFDAAGTQQCETAALGYSESRLQRRFTACMARADP